MKKYNVIWFDDKFETLNITYEKAFLNGINLIGFTNVMEGVHELKHNISDYDAAILDGNFYQSPEQSGDEMDDTAMFNVGLEIEKLSSKKKLPWFILSGEMNFTKEKNKFAQGFDKKVYNKLIVEDLDLLWNDLRKAADQQPETQIRHEFANVFEVCTEQYIGVSAQKPLLTILKSLKDPTLDFDDELYFTQIRIILEALFRCANRIGLLHDKCIQGGKVNLTESSLFLSGEQTKHIEVWCKKVHFPKLISESVKSILFITGAASHTVDPDIRNNINLDQHRATNNTPYLLYSLTFQLMDILVWFKRYADENNDIKANKSHWLPEQTFEGEWLEGNVINLNPIKGYAFFKPKYGVTNTLIPHPLVTQNKLSNDDSIIAIIETYNDNRTNETKTRVKEIKKT